MMNNEFIKTIVTLLLGIAGPMLCYIVVYGSASIFRFIYLQIKAKRFKKRLSEVQKNMNRDDFDDIEVEVVTSYDKNKKEIQE